MGFIQPNENDKRVKKRNRHLHNLRIIQYRMSIIKDELVEVGDLDEGVKISFGKLETEWI